MRKSTKFDDGLEVGLLILNELSGEYLAKHPKFFLKFISLTETKELGASGVGGVSGVSGANGISRASGVNADPERRRELFCLRIMERVCARSWK